MPNAVEMLSPVASMISSSHHTSPSRAPRNLLLRVRRRQSRQRHGHLVVPAVGTRWAPHQPNRAFLPRPWKIPAARTHGSCISSKTSSTCCRSKRQGISRLSEPRHFPSKGLFCLEHSLPDLLHVPCHLTGDALTLAPWLLAAQALHDSMTLASRSPQ